MTEPSNLKNSDILYKLLNWSVYEDTSRPDALSFNGNAITVEGVMDRWNDTIVALNTLPPPTALPVPAFTGSFADSLPALTLVETPGSYTNGDASQDNHRMLVPAGYQLTYDDLTRNNLGSAVLAGDAGGHIIIVNQGSEPYANEVIDEFLDAAMFSQHGIENIWIYDADMDDISPRAKEAVTTLIYALENIDKDGPATLTFTGHSSGGGYAFVQAAIVQALQDSPDPHAAWSTLNTRFDLCLTDSFVEALANYDLSNVQLEIRTDDATNPLAAISDVEHILNSPLPGTFSSTAPPTITFPAGTLLNNLLQDAYIRNTDTVDGEMMHAALQAGSDIAEAFRSGSTDAPLFAADVEALAGITVDANDPSHSTTKTIPYALNILQGITEDISR